LSVIFSFVWHLLQLPVRGKTCLLQVSARGWEVEDGKDFFRTLLLSSVGFGHLTWTSILLWLTLLSFNSAPRILIYSRAGNRPGEGGRVRCKAELPSSRIQICRSLWMQKCLYCTKATAPQRGAALGLSPAPRNLLPSAGLLLVEYTCDMSVCWLFPIIYSIE